MNSVRDLALRVGITERSTQRIVADLIEEGYLKLAKVGRRNRYEIRLDLPLRHPIERENEVGVLLKLLGRKAVPRKINARNGVDRLAPK